MAKVKLILLNIFYLLTHVKSIEYEGKTVKDIISQFLTDYGDKLDHQIVSKNRKKLDSQILILVNGRNIKYLDGYKTKLKDDWDIHLSVPLAGG